MPETPVLVVVEVISVQDPGGLQAYAKRANELIGSVGGVVLSRGGSSFDGEAAFGTLVIERWPSEGAFRAWMESEAYRPLRELRRASAAMRVAILPISSGLDL